MEEGYASRNENEEEAQLIEDALCPPDDTVEIALSKLVGLEAVKNQIRGMRRTMELVKSSRRSMKSSRNAMEPQGKQWDHYGTP